MFKDSKAFSGYSIDDLAAAKVFYAETLGLEVTEDSSGLGLNLAAGRFFSTRSRTTSQPPSPSSTSWSPISTPPSMN